MNNLPNRGVEDRDLEIAERHQPKNPQFSATEWEEVGPRILAKDFEPMTTPIVPSNAGISDPMFPNFDYKNQAKQKFTRAPRSREQIDKEEVDGVVSEAEIQQREQVKFEAGHSQGFEEGLQKGREEVGEHQAQLSQQFQEFAQDIAEQLSIGMQEIEAESVRLAIAISKKILETTAEVKPDYILDVVRNGLKELGAAKPFRIRVSPQDFEFIEVVGVPPELSPQELGVEYVLDESIKSGCVIETDFGETDLQLNDMWEQIQANLYESLKQ